VSTELPDDEIFYELKESFDIDNGSLAGLTPEEAFVLGVEWECVWRKMQRALVTIPPLREFRQLVHLRNVGRLRALAERRAWISSSMAMTDPNWRDMRFVKKQEQPEAGREA
jgi:hypothetical protein